MSEFLKGTGKVFDGDQFLADADYVVTTTTKRAMGVIVSASVTCAIRAISSKIPERQETYTLHMTDGRKLKFYMLHNGKVEATGGPY